MTSSYTFFVERFAIQYSTNNDMRCSRVGPVDYTQLYYRNVYLYHLDSMIRN